MLRLYRAANLPEAHLLMHLLQHSGIAAHVFNENAQSGVGQLPFTETYPEVWIEREADLQRAQTIASGFDRRGSDSLTERACSDCGQSSPGVFEVCWNCGASL